MGKKCHYCNVDEEDCSSDHEMVCEINPKEKLDKHNEKRICCSCYCMDKQFEDRK